MSSVGVTVNEIRMMRAFKMEALESQAEMLAFNSTGVLSFQEVPAAGKLLESLKSQPTVEFACLYDAEGRAMATYPANANITPLPPARRDGRVCRLTASGRFEVFRHVIDRGESGGHIVSSRQRPRSSTPTVRLHQDRRRRGVPGP